MLFVALELVPCHNSDVLQAQGAFHRAVRTMVLAGRTVYQVVHGPEVPAIDMPTSIAFFQHKFFAALLGFSSLYTTTVGHA